MKCFVDLSKPLQDRGVGRDLLPRRAIGDRHGSKIAPRKHEQRGLGQFMKRKLRILEVDDEPIIGESIALALEAPNRKIVVAKDGKEALALAAKQKFDVVITDHRMPRTGGLELVRKLRERNYAGKIIVLSGHLSPENIGPYEDLDVDEVVGKPLHSEELRTLIEDLEEFGI
jgi:CheY-like chemotaxis protein